MYQVLILSVLLSCVAAWAIAHRYRRRMQQLMRAPRVGDPHESKVRAGEATADYPTAAPFSLVDNRAAGMRLAMLLIASSFLIAGTSACIYCLLKFPGDPLSPWRVIPIALLHLWPVVPALALIWRWSVKRLFATLLLWCAATFIVLLIIGLWRQIEIRPLLLLGAMASDIGLSLALLSLVFLGSATRAIAPWLVMPTAVLVWSSLAGVHAMMYVGEHQPPFAMSLIELLDPWLGWLPWYGVLLLFVLLPWALVWWLVRILGRALGRAYSRKRLSDLLVVFAGVWVFALTDRAVMVVDPLQALVRCSDVVLMDLCGFQAHNAGCRYELTTLACESRDLRVVVLTDGRTDRAAAEEAVASGRQERFTWIEASRFDASKRRQVLESLFA
ncbi:MAG: hypothetical protein KIS79_12570 [Burkholderiales bacterium]|nr:hypothetical protein [Burkholderiales bacterium]